RVQLWKLLESLETSTDLEGTAIITKEGLRIASSTNAEVQSDAHSASPSVLISLGEKFIRDLQYGNLTEILISGEEGYTIIIVGDEHTNFILISHSKKASKLGYYFHRLRKAYKLLSDLLKDIEISKDATY
ncbi:MAG: roadblock/LC7 domain-containing protein, partial [Promethearchaeota archaeon]